MTIKNEHWERNKLEKECQEYMDNHKPSFLPQISTFLEQEKIGILADICDNLTVISNILLNSKGGK